MNPLNIQPHVQHRLEQLRRESALCALIQQAPKPVPGWLWGLSRGFRPIRPALAPTRGLNP